MVQASLDLASTPTKNIDPESMLGKVALLFMRQPNEWVESEVLARVGGRCAWRTRCSECRTLLGMNIVNRVRTVRDHAADCPGLQAWDIPEACQCRRNRVYRISEYKYVPDRLGA